MPVRDFFVFCTSLSPIELRAVGALSRVRHFVEAETIYRAGDRGDTFFIVNRGVVELVPSEKKNAIAPILLSRGDIFGDVELLTDRMRLHRAVAREPLSLQCFDHGNFAELVRRVPSFYRFLCEKLAHRVVQAHETAGVPEDELELTGNLANFDLVTVYQTIVQAAQTGELNIVSEAGELIAEFHFSLGHPVTGRFQHLAGEDAFWQLFLADHLRGTFSFSSGRTTWDEPRVRTLHRPANDMLFSAMQFRDEFQALKAEMPATSVYEVRRTDFSVTFCDPAISSVALEQVWRCCSERSFALSALFARCSVSELKIYQAVKELARTGHLGLSRAGKAEKVA